MPATALPPELGDLETIFPGFRLGFPGLVTGISNFSRYEGVGLRDSFDDGMEPVLAAATGLLQSRGLVIHAPAGQMIATDQPWHSVAGKGAWPLTRLPSRS